MNKKMVVNYGTICLLTKSQSDTNNLLSRFSALYKLNPECIIEGNAPDNPNISILYYQKGTNPNYLLLNSSLHIGTTIEITDKKNMVIVTGKVKKLLRDKKQESE